jgi:hypothetical protein
VSVAALSKTIAAEEVPTEMKDVVLALEVTGREPTSGDDDRTA